ncbi:hypothetical protein Dsin_031715 [Dipteronia sinensis]|uniref:glucan endo-1,3-beta-D-glucosidase n=1 Tax=Dipteronia sinensis TaxID=43782 RepID=A0AAE0DSL4_9ROSI|nr:hypothetical protein Dsin_031715 [Dipteronia sinensis]
MRFWLLGCDIDFYAVRRTTTTIHESTPHDRVNRTRVGNTRRDRIRNHAYIFFFTGEPEHGTSLCFLLSLTSFLHLRCFCRRPSFAATWVEKNVAAYYPETQIEAIAVGNEVFVDPHNTTKFLVPAMKNIHEALVKSNLHSSIKVSSPIALSALQSSYPSSAGSFRPELVETVFRPMFDFLRQTGSNKPVAKAPINGGGGVSKSTSGNTWCVAKGEAGKEKLQSALDYACGEGGADCRPIQQGSTCYNPNSLEAHASFAFNSYYQKQSRAGGSCYFGGAAYVVTQPPKYGECEFPTGY